MIADYVIVGGGSAGCVLANRLSANPAVRVVLIEAGDDDRPLPGWRQFASNLMIHVPAGFARTVTDPKVNWLYRSAPDAGTGGRVHPIPRGKVLGGSSSINGMIYIRGQAADYDRWGQLGCSGWSWDDVRPYFERARACGGCQDDPERGGPLAVALDGPRHPVSDAAITAAGALGVPERDVNDADQEGACYYQRTMRGGMRCSAAVAYLHPAMGRSNLQVLTRAQAMRVLFNGRTASGVAIARGSSEGVVHARREVILAAGAIGSPQLLQLSGVGAGPRLNAHGVPVVCDSPEVGEGLQDHFIVPLRYRLHAGVPSFNMLSRGMPLAGEVLRYAHRRNGLLAQTPAQAAIFVRSHAGLVGPDIRLHVMPATVDSVESARLGKLRLERQPGLTIAAGGLQPHGRGHVRIASADWRDHPEIAMNFLSDPLDQAAIVAALRWARDLAAQAPLAQMIRSGPLIDNPEEGYEALLALARVTGASDNHVSGTCRMGIDPGAVLDPTLRVRGVNALRVVDASIMPRLISGNTNAPVMMIAEKAADLILGRVAAVA